MTSTANAPFDNAELERLAGLSCEDQLTAADIASLETILRASSDARRFYLEYIDQHSNLLSEFGEEEAVSSLPVGRAVRDEHDETHPARGACPTPRKSLLQWASRNPKGPAVAIAATVLIAALVVMGVTPMKHWMAGDGKKADEKHAATPGKQDFVARLSDWQNDVWLEDTRPPLDDPRLRIGKRLVIESGLIEVTYLTGAKVVIEGPAEFVVGGNTVGNAVPGVPERHKGRSLQENAANSGFLRLGSLVARVEDKTAQGFIISTPVGDIEDLGTEFAIHVDKNRGAKLHVFDGSVKVVGNRDTRLEPRVLRAGKTVAWDTSSPPRELDRHFFSRYAKMVESMRPSEVLVLADSFDVPTTGDIQQGLAQRQAGLLAPVSYSGDTAGGSQVDLTRIERDDSSSALLLRPRSGQAGASLVWVGPQCDFSSVSELPRRYRIELRIDPDSPEPSGQDWIAVLFGVAKNAQGSWLDSAHGGIAVMFRENGGWRLFDGSGNIVDEGDGVSGPRNVLIEVQEAQASTTVAVSIEGMIRTKYQTETPLAGGYLSLMGHNASGDDFARHVIENFRYSLVAKKGG